MRRHLIKLRPEGVFQTVVGDSSIAETLIDSDGINAISFTGSVPVGAKVAQRATSQLKKTVLELGGRIRSLCVKMPILKKHQREQ